MKIPRLFYGPRAQVVPRVRKLARGLLKSRDWRSFDPGPFLDTAEVDGQVLVDRPVVLGDPHFHCYALSEELAGISEQDQLRQNVHEWLMGSLDEDWRFMCTLGGASRLGLDTYDPRFSRRYVEAAIRYWPIMAPLHERFHNVLQPTSVLNCWYTLIIAFDILGLPAREQLRQPNREPAALLALVDGRGAAS